MTTTTKTFPVIMLPINRASNIGDKTLYLEKHTDILRYGELVAKDNMLKYPTQHLYIVSDNEIIKEGDLVLDSTKQIRRVLQRSDDNRLYLSGIDFLTIHPNSCKKIISSTDKEITPKSWIPYSFINTYMIAYNKGMYIQTVNLELKETIYNPEFDTIYIQDCEKILKINTNADGSVIVIDSPKQYTIKDLKESAWRAYKYSQGLEAKYFEFEEWFDTQIF